MSKKVKNVFIKGAISPSMIAESITRHQTKKNIGAHDIFLGQVRADNIQGNEVTGIEYSAYEEMALNVFEQIKNNAFEKYNLTCLHIYHSLGLVKAGELCLFVFVSSERRKTLFKALEFVVEEIKSKAPIFGKEIFVDKSYQWKVNN